MRQQVVLERVLGLLRPAQSENIVINQRYIVGIGTAIGGVQVETVASAFETLAPFRTWYSQSAVFNDV